MRGGRTVPETKQPYRQANNDFRSPPYDGGRGRTQKPGKPWTHGLCSCCDDCGELITCLCCPCCFLPILAIRAKEMPAAVCCGGPHVLRTKIREERKISGTVCGDCCATYWCPCCAIIQMSKEARDTDALI